MKKITYLSLVALLMLVGLSACEKDALVDGGLSNENVNMTTYDFLKSHPKQMFDTTLMIIDKAGMKDLINSDGTFFVPNDYAIANYLTQKQKEARADDERKNFTLDSLMKFTPQMLRDSMGIYFFKSRITRDKLTDAGTEFQTSTAGVKLNVSLEEQDAYQQDGVITTKPKYIYLIKVLGDRDIKQSNGVVEDPSGDDELIDIRVLCQTTGIITTTGVVHVLSNSDIWTFKKAID